MKINIIFIHHPFPMNPWATIRKMKFSIDWFFVVWSIHRYTENWWHIIEYEHGVYVTGGAVWYAWGIEIQNVNDVSYNICIWSSKFVGKLFFATNISDIGNFWIKFVIIGALLTLFSIVESGQPFQSRVFEYSLCCLKDVLMRILLFYLSLFFESAIGTQGRR